LLVGYFIAKYAHKNSKYITGISNRAMDALKDYSFPGNVRELGNIIESAVVLTRERKIRFNDLSEEMLHGIKVYKSADIIPSDRKDILLKTLKRIKVTNRRRSSVLWHNTLKCVTIYKICEFLTKMGDQWFSRKEFAKFLRNHSKSDRDKYKTAGGYLKILKENNICVHNEKKANKSGYRLAGSFITKTKSH